MRWNHLPVDGGLYDQNPRLLEKWAVIFQIKAEYEKREAKRRESEAKRGGRMPRQGASRAR
jgi:hypothetical protein